MLFINYILTNTMIQNIENFLLQEKYKKNDDCFSKKIKKFNYKIFITYRKGLNKFFESNKIDSGYNQYINYHYRIFFENQQIKRQVFRSQRICDYIKEEENYLNQFINNYEEIQRKWNKKRLSIKIENFDKKSLILRNQGFLINYDEKDIIYFN